MSDNIPFEIQMEIIQRIHDTKSLIRCRSVSKAWKSVIDSKDFVKAHTLRHQAHNRHHLLIRKRDFGDEQVKYVSIVDDETFPHQKVSDDFVPDSFNNLSYDLIGTSLGLFGLYERETDTAVMWNPTIRKTVAIPVPNLLRKKNYWTVIGFGVCPRNLDPNLVKITFVDDLRRLQDVNASTQVEVFTLSSGGTWRSPLSGNLPHKSIGFRSHQAVVDGFIYWDAVDRINVDDRFENLKLIMSFDLTSEEFTKVNLPDPLALNRNAYTMLSNLRESLAVLNGHFNICHVWQMIGHGCSRSFNKLYSINIPDVSIHKTLGFRKSGEPIIEVDNDKEDYCKYERALAIYEPESKSIISIGIYGILRNFFVHSYMETLLLLGH